MNQKVTLQADKIVTFKQFKVLSKCLEEAKTAALATKTNFKYVQDYFLIVLGYFTACRISEISNLTWDDVGDDFLIVRKGKGGKSRTVFFGNKTKALFREFKAFQQEELRRSCEGENFVFRGQRGKLTRSGIHARIKYWIKRAGLADSISYHSLRHGAATNWLEGGVPLSTVQHQLGHSNISVTSIYLHFTSEGKDKVKSLT